MTFSAQKLRSIVNLLSDPGSAANAAGILAREAKERWLLVSDLIGQVTASATATSPSPSQPAPSSPPSFRDVDPIDEDDGGPYTKRIGPDHIGLVSEIIAETDKAWCAQLPSGDEMWLAKSVVENHGGDAQGRAIFVLPRWLAKKGGLL
jgi:hypothetical protein